MQNKEQLLHFFLSGKFNLSQYDQKFLSNLQFLIHTKDRVTTNQSALFDKLTAKYRKQLEKNNVTEEQIEGLSWKTNLVESTAEYTGARIDLTDGKLNLRLPFNKPFINHFKELDNNPFEWQREERMYSAEFSTMALKILYTLLPSFFNSVSYSADLFQVIKELEQYSAVYWSPTLVKTNGVYYIAAINESLHNAIVNIPLDASPKSILHLSKYGIKVSPELIESKPQEISAEFVTKVVDTEIAEMIDWLNAVDVKTVYWAIRKGKAATAVSTFATLFTSLMEHHGIKLVLKTSGRLDPSDPFESPDINDEIKVIVQAYHPPAYGIKNTYALHYDKMFVIKNSNSIEVK